MTCRVPFAFGIGFAAIWAISGARTAGWGMSCFCPSRRQSTKSLLSFDTDGDFFVLDGNNTVYKKTRAECFGWYRYQPFRCTSINSNVVGGVLISPPELHWSYTYTRALGDSSSCICWHSILYDVRVCISFVYLLVSSPLLVVSSGRLCVAW